MWPDSLATQELILKADGENPDAMDALLQRYRDGIKNMIKCRMDARLKQRVDESDIVQDVMLEASTRMEKYRDDQKMPFGICLRQLATDRMIDLYRQHCLAQKRDIRKERAVADNWNQHSTIMLVNQLQDPHVTPAQNAINQELQERMMAQIEELESEDREILFMRHIEQLSNSEIANILGLTAPAASMRYLRALKKLQSRMQPYIADSSEDASNSTG